MTVLIVNADWVITMDPGRRILRNASILIAGDRIVAVEENAVAQGSPDLVIDGRGKLVIPGLIDAHVHNALRLGLGIGDEANFVESFVDRYFPFERCLTEEHVAAGSQLCQLELIKNGISSFIDPGSEFPGVTARITAETGLRGVVAPSLCDAQTGELGAIPNSKGDAGRQLAAAEALFSEWNGAGGGRLLVWFELRPPRNCSDPFLKAVFALAEQLNTRVQAHSASTRASIAASRAQWGVSDVERLSAHGLLGPHLLLAHMGQVSPRELDLLAAADVRIAHCPSASMHGAYGVLREGCVPEMLASGMTVGLGNDSAGSGNFIDLIRQVYLACCGHKETRLDASIMSPELGLELVTLHGARAMGLENEIGSLEVGKKADIALFRCDSAEMAPLTNPVAALVYAGSGRLADTLLVDGRILMLEGVVQSLVESEVVRRANQTGWDLLHRAGLLTSIASKWQRAVNA